MLQATRRTVLRSTAWAAPAVTLASASPAFASSPGSDFVFTAGSSSVVPDGDFFSVRTTNAVVAVARDALSAPAQLTLTVTFVPTAGDDELYSEFTAPPGWLPEPRSAGVRNVLVFTYGRILTGAGATVPFGDGTWFGTDDVAQKGTFVLTFRVGLLMTEWLVSTH